MRKCPQCGKRAKRVNTWRVKGVKNGSVPGIKRLYRCLSCGASVHTLEIDPKLLADLQEQFHERRLSWNAEKARLREEIRLLKQPSLSGKNRVQKIRGMLVKVLEETY